MKSDPQASPFEASVSSQERVWTRLPSSTGLNKVLMGTCALLMGIVAACTFGVGVRTGDNVPFVPDSEAHISGTIGNGQLTLKPTSSVPEGTCIKVTWLDGSGKPMGSNNATVGGAAVPIPEGAKGADFSPCEDEQNSKVKLLDVQQSLVAKVMRRVFFQEMPVNFDDGHGRWAEFTVVARNKSNAETIATDFRDGMFLEPTPVGVEPGPIVDIDVLSDGRVRVTAMVESTPTALDLRWNGSPLFTLLDAQVSSANGWYAVSCTVPSDLVATPSLFSSATNEVYVLVEQTDRGPWSFEAEVEIEL